MADKDTDVLVVDDDPELNELVGAYVQIAGFKYRSAADGTDALRQARERHLALIVLDVMLPDVDGFEVCRRLKKEETTRKIPVVMLTALDRDDYRRQGTACGADDFITKPFDPDRLLHSIKEHARHNGENGSSNGNS